MASSGLIHGSDIQVYLKTSLLGGGAHFCPHLASGEAWPVKSYWVKPALLLKLSSLHSELISSVTRGALWLSTDLCGGEQDRKCVRGQIYQKFKSLINPTVAPRACDPQDWRSSRPSFGHAAAVCVLSSAVSRFCCLSRCIHNWTALLLLLHCPPETSSKKRCKYSALHSPPSLFCLLGLCKN